MSPAICQELKIIIMVFITLIKNNTKYTYSLQFFTFLSNSFHVFLQFFSILSIFSYNSFHFFLQFFSILFIFSILFNSFHFFLQFFSILFKPFQFFPFFLAILSNSFQFFCQFQRIVQKQKNMKRIARKELKNCRKLLRIDEKEQKQISIVVLHKRLLKTGKQLLYKCPTIHGWSNIASKSSLKWLCKLLLAFQLKQCDHFHRQLTTPETHDVPRVSCSC